MKKNISKNIGFYIYSYYQAKEVIYFFKNRHISPYIGFDYALLNGIGINYILEVSKLLIKDFSKKDFKIFLNCKNNPALVLECIKLGFCYIKFDGNKVLKKKINYLSNSYNIVLNPKIQIFDLKKYDNLDEYLNKKIYYSK